MEIEHKAVGVCGVKQLSDKGDGLVRAIVSVTGIKDNVNDIIEPGAYEKSLTVRTPKGVWHHNWHESVSRTEVIKELLPGDKELPKTMPNGDPWPKEAGALQVDTRFNLKTQRGKEAYEDVLFFGPQQEWSIGYNVPVGGAVIDSKTGVRKIKALDLYEYSPVLFGAMPVARTASVKDAQTAWGEIKSLHGDDAHKFLMEIKSLVGEDVFEGKVLSAEEEEEDRDASKHPEGEPGTVYDVGDDDDQGLPEEGDWVEDDEDDETKAMPAVSADAIRRAIESLQALLPDAPNEEDQEEKSMQFESKDLQAMLKGMDVTDSRLLQKAADFEAATEAADQQKMDEAGTDLLDFAEALIEFDVTPGEAKELAAYIADSYKEALDLDDDEEDDGDGEDAAAEDREEDEDDYGEKAKVRTAAGARRFGQPIGSTIVPDLRGPSGGPPATSSSERRRANRTPAQRAAIGRLRSTEDEGPAGGRAATTARKRPGRDAVSRAAQGRMRNASDKPKRGSERTPVEEDLSQKEKVEVAQLPGDAIDIYFDLRRDGQGHRAAINGALDAADARGIKAVEEAMEVKTISLDDLNSALSSDI